VSGSPPADGEAAAGPLGAVVFDFDGLILDTEMPEYLTVSAAFAEHGVDLRLDDWLAVIGRGDNRHWLDWLEEEVGAPIEREVVHARRLAEHHAMIAEKEVLPGVVDILDQAEALAVPALVASSSPRYWVVDHLQRLGLHHRFVGIFCRDDVVPAKPWPDLYLAAVAAVGVAPAQAVAFEDSFNGSLAATDAGLYCVVAPNELTRSQDFAHCDLVVGSLADVDLTELSRRLAR